MVDAVLCIVMCNWSLVKEISYGNNTDLVVNNRVSTGVCNPCFQI